MVGGGVLGVAEVVKGLHSLSRLRPLPTKERDQYDNARHLLVAEVAASLGVSAGLAEDLIDYALMPPAGTHFKLKPPPKPILMPSRPPRRRLVVDEEGDGLDDLGLDDLGIEGLVEEAGAEVAAEATGEAVEDEGGEAAEAGEGGEVPAGAAPAPAAPGAPLKLVPALAAAVKAIARPAAKKAAPARPTPAKKPAARPTPRAAAKPAAKKPPAKAAKARRQARQAGRQEGLTEEDRGKKK